MCGSIPLQEACRCYFDTRGQAESAHVASFQCEGGITSSEEADNPVIAKIFLQRSGQITDKRLECLDDGDIVVQTMSLCSHILIKN